MDVSPQILIVMGSDSDLPTMSAAAQVLDELELPYELRVLSAHRTPEAVKDLADKARERGIRVVIAGAGGAAHLAGVIASHTTLPVLAVPMPSAISGIDSLYSSVQMPGGIPVATLAIGKAGAKNAGILAGQILGVADDDVRRRVDAHRATMRRKVLARDARVVEMGWARYLDEKSS